MTRKCARSLGASVMLLLLTQAGCVMYAGKELPTFSAFPRVESKPSVEIAYSFCTYLNDHEQPATEFFRERFQKKIMERFSKSGLYASVALQNTNAELRVQVEIRHDGYGYQALAALCGMTLTIIPCRAEDDYHVTASVYNRRTRSTSRVQVADSQVLWMNLLLLPALPFNTNQEAFEKQSLNRLMDVFALRVYEAAQE